MILDTNALSAFADGVPSIATKLARIVEIAVPVVVLGEYQYGITHSTHRRQYEAWLESYSNIFRLLDITGETARHYAEIRSELRKPGKPIPSNDTWIAALAREHNLDVMSRDTHFDRVAGLRRISW